MARGAAAAGIADRASPATPAAPFADIAADRGAVVGAGLRPARPRRSTEPMLERAVAAGARGRRAHRRHPGGRHQARRRADERLGASTPTCFLHANERHRTAPTTTACEKATDLAPGRHRLAGASAPGCRSWSRACCAPTTRAARVEAGAAAVWVSNHGGRQLDRRVATALRAARGRRRGRRRGRGVRRRRDARAVSTCWRRSRSGADAAFLGRPALLGPDRRRSARASRGCSTT